MKIIKMIRPDTPYVGGVNNQIHAHSTANKGSTAYDEANFMNGKNLEEGYYTDVVGNGVNIQTAEHGRGAYDVGGEWNKNGYASVELIESHKTKEEFLKDYVIYVTRLRDVAKENNIPLKLDTGTTGILTHEYCTFNQPNNHSDHIDPYPYLKSWGISREQFKKDVENGFSNNDGKTWHKDNHGWWIRDKKGYAPRGWHKMDNKWYYISQKTGYMITGWFDSDYWYYFKKNGEMVTGWKKVGDYFYFFDNNGRMLKGWINGGNGTWYYTRYKKEGKAPLGSEVFGWYKIKNKWYYFENNGKMLYDTDKIIKGKKYHFDKNGVCLNP